MTDDAASYARDGYVYLPSLISSAEARTIATELALISGLAWDDATEVINGKDESFYRHGGVATNPKLWPLLVHPRLVDAVATALATPPHCLPGIDTIGMHASEPEPHRDSSPGELPATVHEPDPSWFPVVRVILYPASPGAELGLLPGSHRRPGEVRKILDGTHYWRWQTLRDSDALLFDPCVIHAGAPVSGPIPLVVLTFGADSPHALQTYFHARVKTRRLGFPDPPTDLVTLLSDHGLLLPGCYPAYSTPRIGRLTPLCGRTKNSVIVSWCLGSHWVPLRAWSSTGCLVAGHDRLQQQGNGYESVSIMGGEDATAGANSSLRALLDEAGMSMSRGSRGGDGGR